MWHILYFTLWAAFKVLGVATECKGRYLENNIDPAVQGGASHECYRECVANDTRICYYEFFLSEWLTMSSQCSDCPYTSEDCYNTGCLTAGGDVRTVTVVNHMLPGPSIQVCKGDTIQVNLTNGLSSEGASIHWHGMSQIDTPYMDGVPFVSQCPILPGNTFLYNFTADPVGTHIWHSHVGFQETDGFYGSLIIREPDDVNADYYDYDLSEHIMMIWHWYGTTTGHKMNQFLHQSTAPSAYSITINGWGATVQYSQDDQEYYTPRANFTVVQGYRYKFRAIANSAVYCPIQVSVDNHTLNIIATDGATVEPVEVDSFIINAGERYDFVLTADQEAGNYWIRYRCMSDTSTSAVAKLCYNGTDDVDPSGTTDYDDANRSGVLLNPVGESATDYSNNTLIRVSDLTNTVADAQNISGTPDYTVYISIAMNQYSGYQTPGPYGQMDNISFSSPPVPLLTQYSEITSDMYCTQEDDTAKSCKNDYCTCPLLWAVEKDALLEVIVVDTTVKWTDDHPIHFHGHYGRVVALVPGNGTAITVAEVKAMNEAGLISKNLDTAPLKDTIGVPARGIVILRAIVDNPGFWLFHCHIAAHSEEGMGGVFQVGNYSEMVHAPDNFPTCGGNYDITYSS